MNTEEWMDAYPANCMSTETYRMPGQSWAPVIEYSPSHRESSVEVVTNKKTGDYNIVICREAFIMHSAAQDLYPM